jgi:superfamily I DNA/RNA helicase
MWDKGLKDEALEIAKTHRSPLRVIAGPGTGKTFALIRRVARIVEEGQDPRRILLVTFTRVSATDLERELDKLGLPQGHNVVKGTLHSLAFSFLHRQNVLDFTHRVARPLLKFEERFLLEDLVLYGDFGIIHQRRAILKAFEAAWAREQNQQPGSPENQSDQNFQVQLEEWLRFHEGMLIGEIIPQTLRYLRANPESEELRQFDHVLVDEYQDLNRAEQSLIDLLAQRGSIAVVGDQDQAIYESFRYAHPEGISEFHTTHNNTYDVPLKTSHRCPSSIVSLANALIRNNMRRSKRQLIPTDEKQPVNVSLVQWTDMETESTNMADYITTRVHDGRYDPGQILILCARRQFGYLIRDNLRARGIPAFSYFDEEELDGDPKIIENSEAQQAFAVLTLLSSRHDRVALRAWLGFGSQSLKNKGYKRIRDYCSTTGLSPFEVLDSLAQGSLEIPYTNGIVSRYQELIQKLNKLNSLPLQEAIDLLFPAEKPWAEPFRSMYSEVKEKPNQSFQVQPHMSEL